MLNNIFLKKTIIYAIALFMLCGCGSNEVAEQDSKSVDSNQENSESAEGESTTDEFALSDDYLGSNQLTFDCDGFSIDAKVPYFQMETHPEASMARFSYMENTNGVNANCEINIYKEVGKQDFDAYYGDGSLVKVGSQLLNAVMYSSKTEDGFRTTVYYIPVSDGTVSIVSSEMNHFNFSNPEAVVMAMQVIIQSLKVPENSVLAELPSNIRDNANAGVFIVTDENGVALDGSGVAGNVGASADSVNSESVAASGEPIDISKVENAVRVRVVEAGCDDGAALIEMCEVLESNHPSVKVGSRIELEDTYTGSDDDCDASHCNVEGAIRKFYNGTNVGQEYSLVIRRHKCFYKNADVWAIEKLL